MNARTTTTTPANEPLSGRAVCPQCDGPLSRISRRLIDRIASLVRPVQRYRCRNFSCLWVGNILNASKAPDPTDRPPL